MRFGLIGMVGLVFALAGCERSILPKANTPTEAPVVASETQTPGEETLRPTERPDVDQTVEQETPAKESTPAPSGALGETVASLGLLDRSGLWLRTPLVSSESQGRVTVSATGASIDLLLLPLDGPEGGGSQLSLDAMLALGVSITDLVPVQVTRL